MNINTGGVRMEKELKELLDQIRSKYILGEDAGREVDKLFEKLEMNDMFDDDNYYRDIEDLPYQMVHEFEKGTYTYKQFAHELTKLKQKVIRRENQKYKGFIYPIKEKENKIVISDIKFLKETKHGGNDWDMPDFYGKEYRTGNPGWRQVFYCKSNGGNTEVDVFYDLIMKKNHYHISFEPIAYKNRKEEIARELDKVISQKWDTPIEIFEEITNFVTLKQPEIVHVKKTIKENSEHINVLFKVKGINLDFLLTYHNKTNEVVQFVVDSSMKPEYPVYLRNGKPQEIPIPFLDALVKELVNS